MKRSELKELIKDIVLAEVEGYTGPKGKSNYYDGETPGLTTKVMNTILMNLAKSAKDIDNGEEDEDSNNED